MVSFLYPLFLIGAAAAAIPVLLHLLKNEQAPEVRFSAVRLLRGVRVEQAQRRRIRDWLLLALRVTALLLLALAFARPFVSRDRAAGSRTTILVLDRSGSMGAPAVWSRARAAALGALDASPAGEPVGLVVFDDRAEVLVEPTADRAAIRAALQRVQPGIGGTRYSAALARAVSVLDDSHAGTARVILIGDLQGTPGAVRATIPESVGFEAISAGAVFDNVALLGVRRTDEGVVATVRNDSGAPRSLRLRLAAGGGRTSEVRIDAGPAQTVEAVFPAAIRAGDVRVSLEDAGPDGLRIDNARFLTLDEGRPMRVLVLAGGGDAFYVDAALRAGQGRPEFDVTTVGGAGVSAALARKPPPDVLFIVGPRGLDRGGREAILRFAQDGGGVFVASADGVNEPGYAGLLSGMQVSAPRGDDPLLTLASFESHHPLFHRLGRAADGLGGARFTRAWRVRAEGWHMLARFDDGAGALYERAEGSGRVVFFASDLNRGWNDLPILSSFVPFVQEVARYLAPEEDRRDYTPATLPPGLTVALGFVDLPTGRRVAVNADVRESDPERMDAAAFRGAVGTRGARNVDPAADRKTAQATESHQALWRYGLMLMLATLVVEGVVGARVRRA